MVVEVLGQSVDLNVQPLVPPVSSYLGWTFGVRAKPRSGTITARKDAR